SRPSYWLHIRARSWSPAQPQSRSNPLTQARVPRRKKVIPTFAKREGRASVLRISKLCENPSGLRLKLEGRIVSEWVSILEEQILECLKKNQKVLLDFSELRFVDKDGVEMLRRMPSEKIEIINCPGFIEEFLK